MLLAEKKHKTAAKSKGIHTLRKQLGSGRQKRSVPVEFFKRNTRSRRDILTNTANWYDRSK